MTDSRKQDRTARRPDCVTEIRMGNSVLVVSGFFQGEQHRNRRRQNGAGAGSRSRYFKTGIFTEHKVADFTLLPLYRQPPLWYNQGTE